MREIMQILVHSHKNILENLFPTVLEWGKIVELESVLKPMYMATTLLSTTSSPTQGDL
ncbi:11466_t:CDS:2 [Funneliformis caledonium]|uniref:11466_t:CDS:1 n=1 Tax=Funneliformis caledonium TaxID=1117310 RepID=A0A9N9J3A6_9GLOM|nr:11466_t:CDS:2 [Funneliformis caledonium]